MPGTARRRLWTGPDGPTLRDRAIRDESAALWLVPSDLARDRVIRGLALRTGPAIESRVWTWDDLWSAIRSGRPDGPAKLSAAGVQAVLSEAIRRALRAGALPVVGRFADSRGFRRRLLGEFASWTRSGVDPAGNPPPGDPSKADDWAVFGRYRAILRRLRAEDAEGMAFWAARSLRDGLPAPIREAEQLIFIEPPAGKAIRAALSALQDRPGSTLATLAWSDEPGRAEVFAPAGADRDRFLAWGFEETRIDPEPGGPAGLETIRRGLFGPMTPKADRSGDPTGLTALGAPRGEGQALAVASRVRGLIGSGTPADEIRVVFRKLDELAGLTRDTLRDWGISACLESPGALATEPVVSTLRAASGLASDGWEAAKLARVLRNGQVRPDWPERTGPLAMAEAASAVVATRVFRGREPIRGGLRRLAQPEDDQSRDDPRRRRRAERAIRSIGIVDRLILAVEAATRPGPWADLSARLRNFAAEIGLGGPGPEARALENLWLALDDFGSVLDGLGLSAEVRTWDAFASDFDRLIADTPIPSGAPRPGAVRLVTSEAIAGGSCDHLILADLAEGTFPDPEAIGDREGGYAREMLRFLALTGSADEGLTLVYPTTDEKGAALLGAAFLDDVRDLFTEDAWCSIRAEVRRLEPGLKEEWARSPALARVHALARACKGGEKADFGPLRSLARFEAHRSALLGTAEALEVAHLRGRSAGFGPHDGLLGDPAAIRKIAGDFGAGRPAFSPSQLETLALCPFQFYLRFVLRLEPTQDRGELEDDFITRGNLIHRALESLHLRLRDAPDLESTISESVKRGIGPAIARELEQESEPATGVESGLRLILAARLDRAGRLYADQFAGYRSKLGASAEARHFEVRFGDVGVEDGPPPLVLGEGDEAVRLQGSIDRIDVLSADGAPRFRVIDYKTGPVPAQAELASGLALQLPLYTLAVERLGLADAEPADFGYWALRKKGFQVAKLGKSEQGGREDWPSYARRLEAFVLALAGHLRRAEFPVAPRSDDCARHCEYSLACRIKQVRALNKTWPDRPLMEPGP